MLQKSAYLGACFCCIMGFVYGTDILVDDGVEQDEVKAVGCIEAATINGNIYGNVYGSPSGQTLVAGPVRGNVYNNITITDPAVLNVGNGNFVVPSPDESTVVTVGNGYDLHVTGSTVLQGSLTTQGDLIFNGQQTVMNDMLTEGQIVSIVGDLMIGTLPIADTTSSSTALLLEVVLPNYANYIGTINCTYMANMRQCHTDKLELFTTRYFVSRMDVTSTATIFQIEDDYYNEAGPMSAPTYSAAGYSRALGVDYSSWVSSSMPDRVRIMYLPPTAAVVRSVHNATVHYEIKSGGVGGSNLHGFVVGNNVGLV